ncbi:MAG TPA: hypothetical protein EYH24_00685 [Thermococcus paralvinellae]|uniref:Transglutaminase-like domain-containing protein n=1 Tax=Thermococcus paralvinellae TaxID=582419 RepID=A0A833E3D9_9EURY|nr:hypothetical protein [Thermococcus paralvinellae]
MFWRGRINTSNMIWAKYHGLGSTKIQKPSETIQSGSGVCVDYAMS